MGCSFNKVKENKELISINSNKNMSEKPTQNSNSCVLITKDIKENKPSNFFLEKNQKMKEKEYENEVYISIENEKEEPPEEKPIPEILAYNEEEQEKIDEEIYTEYLRQDVKVNNKAVNSGINDFIENKNNIINEKTDKVNEDLVNFDFID